MHLFLLELSEFCQIATKNYRPHVTSTVTSDHQSFSSATMWLNKVKSKIWHSFHQQPSFLAYEISTLVVKRSRDLDSEPVRDG